MDAIHICHSLTEYPGDPINPTSIDGSAIVMVGDNTNTSIPMVLGISSFQTYTKVLRRSLSGYNRIFNKSMTVDNPWP